VGRSPVPPFRLANELTAGEICYEWQTWSQYLGVHSTLGESLLQALVYIALAVAFAGAASVLVRSYAPHAYHTGIPEVVSILGGFVLDSFLSPWTLLIKAVGIALAVASGLSLGKEVRAPARVRRGLV
jgi:chloride channel 3/4/5